MKCQYHPKQELDEAGECTACMDDLLDYAKWWTGEREQTPLPKILVRALADTSETYP